MPGTDGRQIKHDEWQTITRNGTDVRLRVPGKQAQAYVEHDGTFVFLTSKTLITERLAGFAAGLRPSRGLAGNAWRRSRGEVERS